ncbi:SDR family oxidoreductase [Frigidibacter sp. ROC022]|uniref:SDR family oxidoreductase n=1 Tax=Frigidibacter sp. ROC022 TaxID=2971796 RepID=UPI00215AE12E|nr:SDR family oxidoreductase [Frigidibacter sp. ROC022]MCR8724746.1 SDR family oxidoreductase [Frigidibacter sp. ROC022]
MSNLLSIGHGYSARVLGRMLVARGWQVTGTSRAAVGFGADATRGLVWPGDDLGLALAEATHLLISVAPDADGDPVLRALGDAIGGAAGHLQWVGYLSTTGVYGDHGGGWVDETTPLTPTTRRGRWRVAAEAEWRALAEASALPLHVFRLAGIYGPGRGPFEKVRKGTARRIVKPGQVFSRIHVEDIAQVLAASMARPDPGAVYNLCDDDPAPPEAVIEEAARLLGLPVPPAEDFESAAMSEMARSFYAESKRVRNDRIKTGLGIRLKYPDYRTGLRALLEADSGRPHGDGGSSH